MVKHDVRLNSPNSLTATNGDVCYEQHVERRNNAQCKTRASFTVEGATKGAARNVVACNETVTASNKQVRETDY